MAATIDCNTEKITVAERRDNKGPQHGDGIVARPPMPTAPFDYAAWLSEYRRWSQRGSCAGARRGEIEWGGEDGH